MKITVSVISLFPWLSTVPSYTCNRSMPAVCRSRVVGSNIAHTFCNTRKDTTKSLWQRELDKMWAVFRVSDDCQVFIRSKASTTKRRRERSMTIALAVCLNEAGLAQGCKLSFWDSRIISIRNAVFQQLRLLCTWAKAVWHFFYHYLCLTDRGHRHCLRCTQIKAMRSAMKKICQWCIL